jgi:hypothetical protein
MAPLKERKNFASWKKTESKQIWWKYKDVRTEGTVYLHTRYILKPVCKTMVPLTYGFTKPYLKRLAFLPLENIDFGKKKKKNSSI